MQKSSKRSEEAGASGPKGALRRCCGRGALLVGARSGPVLLREPSTGMRCTVIPGGILKFPKSRVWHFLSREAIGSGSDKTYINFGCLMISHKKEKGQWSFSV